MLKTAMVAVLVALSMGACVDAEGPTSELGRDCAGDTCGGELGCVAMQADEGVAYVCTHACASPAAIGTGCAAEPFGPAVGYCDAVLADNGRGVVSERTFCFPSCDDTACPDGLYPTERDFGCSCLP